MVSSGPISRRQMPPLSSVVKVSMRGSGPCGCCRAYARWTGRGRRSAPARPRPSGRVGGRCPSAGDSRSGCTAPRPAGCGCRSSGRWPRARLFGLGTELGLPFKPGGVLRLVHTGPDLLPAGPVVGRAAVGADDDVILVGKCLFTDRAMVSCVTCHVWYPFRNIRPLYRIKWINAKKT